MSNRKERGLSERIYLLSAINNNDTWQLSIKGSSNRIYDLLLSSDKISCKCMDFTIRKKICKHLYFIFGRVLNNRDLINDNNLDSIRNKFDIISEELNLVLSNHINNNCDKIEYNKNESCCICFEDFGNEKIVQCKMTCKNIFHSECINLWLSKNNNCPLCRSTWITENEDCLSNFTGIEN